VTRYGVLLTAFGGPGCLEDVEPFMCELMGRRPSEQAVASAKRRYLAIGGSSPLPAIAERIAAQLERELNGLPRAEESEPGSSEASSLLPSASSLRAAEGVKLPVAVGMCYSEPSVGRAVDSLAASGVRTIVWLSLSPFESGVTTGAYRQAVEAAVSATPGVRAVEAATYRRASGFIEFLTEQVVEATHEVDILRHRAVIVFTAHSLPVADAERDASYVDQLREIVAAVAEGAGLGRATGIDSLPGIEAFGGPGVTAPWLLAFQSKGARACAWLEPDLDDVIAAAAAGDFQAVVVCPVGFVTDHMETLYDLDVLAADRALLAGMEFARTSAPNDDARMIDALAQAVRKVM
jgi:ferrochelatase